MGRHRLNRIVSLTLLAVFALRALPDWAVRSSHHCADQDHSGHSMAAMDMSQPPAPAFPTVSGSSPLAGGCTHCPPAECEVTSACALTITASLPTRAFTPASRATHAAVAGTPAS